MKLRNVALLQIAVIAALMMTSQKAEAGLFGCGKTDIACQQRKAARDQEKAAREAAKQQEKANREAEKRARRLGLPWPPSVAQPAPVAVQPQPAPVQPQWQAAPQPVPVQPTWQPAPQPKPQFQPPVNVAPVAPIAAPAPVTNGEVPIDPATGKPLTVAQQRLLEFRQQPKPLMPMIITQPEWTPAIEAQYQDFIAYFGRGVRQSPKRSLKSYMRDAKVNKFAATDAPNTIFYSDCADLPYFLRSYFAYKNGLPMNIATDISISPVPYASLPDHDEKLGGDAASSPYGNIIGGRGLSDIAGSPGREVNYLSYWSRMLDQISTRTFRVGPLSPGYDNSDIYPVKLNRAEIKPGTIVQSEGHVLVVTDIDVDGTINAVDAHPDNSIQFKQIDSSTLSRSRPDHGFGFFNFRPLKAVGGQWLHSGNGQQALYGARIQTASDAELYAQGLWSTEQWFGPGQNLPPQSRPDPNAWKHAFHDIGYFDYLRTQLGSGTVQSDQAVGKALKNVCDVFAQRVPDIADGIASGLTAKAHPPTIPADIFGGVDKDWDAFATPGRDSRIKDAIAKLPNDIVAKYKSGIRGEFKLSFAGTPADYQRAILIQLANIDASCQVTYVKSDNTRVTLNFSELVRRAPRMSFDMADCAEKRWGAGSVEMQSCRDQDPTSQWYNAELSIRNTDNKTDDNENLVVRSDRDITLDMLQSGTYVDQPGNAPIALGVSRSQLVDLKAYISSQQFLNDLSR